MEGWSNAREQRGAMPPPSLARLKATRSTESNSTNGCSYSRSMHGQAHAYSLLTASLSAAGRRSDDMEWMAFWAATLPWSAASPGTSARLAQFYQAFVLRFAVNFAVVSGWPERSSLRDSELMWCGQERLGREKQLLLGSRHPRLWLDRA